MMREPASNCCKAPMISCAYVPNDLREPGLKRYTRGTGIDEGYEVQTVFEYEVCTKCAGHCFDINGQQTQQEQQQ